MTWVEMYNDLRSSAVIRENYQFWFYLYPTAQPFWISAGQLREDLARIREDVDPRRQEPALDQMVLIGHSMGGLVSRLQTIDSRDDFWRLVSDQPFSRLDADPETIAKLEKSLFFQPNPSIRRVVTIGTPHRGSRMSNDLTQWLSHKLIRLPEMLSLTKSSLLRRNKDVIRDDRLLQIKTSVASLAPDSPFFPAMLASYRTLGSATTTWSAPCRRRTGPATCRRGATGLSSWPAPRWTTLSARSRCRPSTPNSTAIPARSSKSNGFCSNTFMRSMPAEVSIRSARPPSTPPRPGNAGRPFRRRHGRGRRCRQCQRPRCPSLPPIDCGQTPAGCDSSPVLSAESRCWRVDGRPTVDQVAADRAPGS